MKLNKLVLKNFKGLESFILETKGKPVDIFGDNATGKTTIFDAVTWLFFGKDSLNSANFDIKTLKPDGEAEHGLEHAVEGIFDIDGNEMILKRIFIEKWIKPRGASERVFSGHNTDYWIDGVPVKQKEYNTHINSLCEENLFKLLSNPRYFNEVMHWQERRKMLLEVCGDISDQDVIKSDASLAELPDILKKRKLEDHRKVIASQKTEINKELSTIPVRIDEIKSSAVTVREKDIVEDDLLSDQDTKKTAEEVLKEIKAGGESAVLTTKLRDIENQISKIDNGMASARITAMTEKAKERQKLKKAVDDIKYSMELIEKDQKKRSNDLKEIEKRIDIYKRSAEQLRKDWFAQDAKIFEFKQSDKCPSCGQDIPKDKLENARKHAVESFNTLKADKLASIDAEGKSIVKSMESEEKDLKSTKLQINNFNSSLKGFEAQLSEAEKALKDFDEKPEAREPDDPERIARLKQKEDIEKQIEAKKGSVDPLAIKEGEAQIEAIEIRIEAYKKELLQIEANKRIDVRVKELSDQERKLSAEFEELERQLYLTEQFIRTKVNLLTEKINSKFKIARFKLFNQNINGGLEECCEVTSNGVPYSSMNNSARINIGLDICNTLSDHFKKSLPVFIDNAEAVTKLLPTSAQQIRLVVSAKDTKLRIETKG